MSYLSESKLTTAASQAAVPARKPRMVISTEGLDGAGKTDFALRNTPRPVLVLDFDFGCEGLGGADNAKLIEGVERIEYNLLTQQSVGGTDEMVRRHVTHEMKRFLTDFRKAIGDGVRTLVVDTFSAAYTGQRIARQDDHYLEMTEEFKSLVQAAYASDKTNLILIHHLKADWAKDKAGKSYKSGTYSRDGMEGIATMVQLAIRQRYVPPVKVGGKLIEDGRFEMEILKCRDQVNLVGQTIPAVDFPTLCTMAYPAIDWTK